jgi:hypothetical protein
VARPVRQHVRVSRSASWDVLDLLRVPRFPLHSGSVDLPARTGDAAPAGRAEDMTDPAPGDAVDGGEGAPSHLSRAYVGKVVVPSRAAGGRPGDRVLAAARRHPSSGAVVRA